MGLLGVPISLARATDKSHANIAMAPPRSVGITAAQQKAVKLEAAQHVKYYTALGQFIFEFSQLEFTIRNFVGMALRLGDDRFDVVTSPYDFTALCNVSRHIALAEKRAADRKAAEALRCQG